MNWQTMRRKGFTPYGPSKAALESASMIWAQDLAGTGITVNTLLPGGATATGNDSGRCPGRGAGDAARPGRHRAAPYLAGLRRRGRRDRQAHNRHRMEPHRSEDGGCWDMSRPRGAGIRRALLVS